MEKADMQGIEGIADRASADVPSGTGMNVLEGCAPDSEYIIRIDHLVKIFNGRDR